VFDLTAVALGRLRKIKIRHNNKGVCSSEILFINVNNRCSLYVGLFSSNNRSSHEVDTCLIRSNVIVTCMSET
jgi:hypothetical protein